MGCSQSKSLSLEEAKLKDIKTYYNNQISYSSTHAKSPATLDISQALKRAASVSSTFVHVETANTTDDNPYGKPIDLFYDGIYDGEILGSGISGIVRECTHKKTGHKYAVKCLDLDKIGDEKGLESLKSEILIMSELDHPSIVRLEEVYESPSEIYLVQQLCHGGELFDKLEEQDDYHYSEAECARLVKQMLCSVRYIHSKGIVHRDLKLENFLFSTKDKNSELKLIDFGLSKYFAKGEVLSEAVGTPYTIAPETILGRYDERVDLWAIGVITYLLLSGETPFGGAGGEEPLTEVRDNILSGVYDYEPDYIWRNISDSAKNFIRELLALNPEDRIASAEIAQQHPWIVNWSSKYNDASDKLSPSVVKNLVEFKEYGDMKKLLCEVLSFTLLPDQIEDLKKEFEILDTNGSGEITMESLKKVLIASASDGSLGLTDEEVVDIFNAMRVNQSQTTIHWHEFIAASLSLCKVDDRNLRIAFDRLDSDHKGYISLENVLNLMGYAEEDQKEEMKRMYMDEMTLGGESKEEGIAYEDFVLLMKGQTKSGRTKQNSSSSLRLEFQESKENDSYVRRGSKLKFAVHLPEHDKGNLLFSDEHKSSLEINRNLYRTHRQFRIQVLEASKRFEELQLRRSIRDENRKVQPALISSHLAQSDFLPPIVSRRMQQKRQRRKKIKSDLSGMDLIPQSTQKRRYSEMLQIIPTHIE